MNRILDTNVGEDIITYKLPQWYTIPHSKALTEWTNLLECSQGQHRKDEERNDMGVDVVWHERNQDFL